MCSQVLASKINFLFLFDFKVDPKQISNSLIYAKQIKYGLHKLTKNKKRKPKKGRVFPFQYKRFSVFWKMLKVLTKSFLIGVQQNQWGREIPAISSILSKQFANALILFGMWFLGLLRMGLGPKRPPSLKSVTHILQ